MKFYFLRMGSEHVNDAVPYCTLDACRRTYETTARGLAQYGQYIQATIHIASKRSEVDEYPDYHMWMGPRGGVHHERVY